MRYWDTLLPMLKRQLPTLSMVLLNFIWSVQKVNKGSCNFLFCWRPDYCLGPHLRQMLSYGCTRLEIGVQSTYEDVARDNNRGHTVAAVADCFYLAKDAGFKVVAQMMPDLPNVGVERDMENFGSSLRAPRSEKMALKFNQHS
ncbi:hypothetical protein FF1_038752 [Malus domestica]